MGETLGLVGSLFKSRAGTAAGEEPVTGAEAAALDIVELYLQMRNGGGGGWLLWYKRC